jgi:hypothetical protein
VPVKFWIAKHNRIALTWLFRVLSSQHFWKLVPDWCQNGNLQTLGSEPLTWRSGGHGTRHAVPAKTRAVDHHDGTTAVLCSRASHQMELLFQMRSMTDFVGTPADIRLGITWSWLRDASSQIDLQQVRGLNLRFPPFSGSYTVSVPVSSTYDDDVPSR